MLHVLRIFVMLLELFETTPFSGVARKARSNIRKGLHSQYGDQVSYTKYEKMKMWNGYYELGDFGPIGFRDVHRTSYTW